MENTSSNQNPVITDVKKCNVLTIRQRIDVILLERGKTWADIYNILGWNRSFASIIRNGKLIPPNWQRVALAKELGVDSSVIWDIPIIQSADKIKEETNENQIK